MTERLWISRFPPIHSAKTRFGPGGSSPRVRYPGGRIPESREGIFRDGQPGIQHCARAPTLPTVRLPARRPGHQHRSCLRSELTHQDIPGIITYVLGIATDVLGNTVDVLGLVADVLSIVTNALGVIVDFPCSIVRCSLYRDLAGHSAKITVIPAARTR